LSDLWKQHHAASHNDEGLIIAFAHQELQAMGCMIVEHPSLRLVEQRPNRHRIADDHRDPVTQRICMQQRRHQKKRFSQSRKPHQFENLTRHQTRSKARVCNAITQRFAQQSGAQAPGRHIVAPGADRRLPRSGA